MAFFTLGCKVNQEETASLEELFRGCGYEVCDFGEEADVYIVNTCAVTHLAARKSRQMLRRAASRNPAALVVALGCYSQVSPEEVLSLPGVDLAIGTQGRARTVELVEEALRRKREGLSPKVNAVRPYSGKAEFEELPLSLPRARTRAFLKIEDGCEQFCTYCLVPFARGPVRSLPPERVKERFEQLLDRGFREIVLTGIHTSAYGRDLGEKVSLASLLRELLEVPGEFRIRLSSVEPGEVSDELLDVVASSPKACRHLHIPLQSGDDEILALMGRPYTSTQYRGLFEKITEKIPGVAVTTDILVGFPGETERHFENSYTFVASLPFRDLHVFKYSLRPGTPAASFPDQVSPSEKERRSNAFLRLAGELSRSFASRFLGAELLCLVEREAQDKPGFLEALSDNYLRLHFPAPPGADLKGRFCLVRAERLVGGDLLEGALVQTC